MEDKEKADGGAGKAGEGKIVKGEVDYGLFVGSNLPSQDVCYQALLSGDPHLDGLLFVGVSSTGIYCRVGVCWAKVPKRENCTFFKTAAEAEAAGYRPCLKCRPELAPGTPIAPDIDHAVASAASSMRERPGDAPIARIAAEQGVSERHLRRLFEQTYGVSPAEYRETCRLLLAKSLLTDTKLSMTRIAYASGFASVRRFNDAFVNSYGMQPTRFRKSSQGSTSATKADAAPIVLHVDYREPYRFDLLLGFLQMRAIEGVEAVLDGAYWRIVRASDGERAGWIKVENDPSHRRLAVTISPELFDDIPSVLARTRRLFDTDCVPGAIERGLADFYEHAGEAYRIPGIRVPCAFDGFEMAARAILGQQITVKAASTLAGRVAREFGTPTKGPIPELTCVFPPPSAFCTHDAPERLGEAGVIAQRANAICSIARAMESGELTLRPGADLAAEASRLGSIRGIGDWTVQYVLMRAYDYPDAFLPTDYGVKLALPDMKPRELEKLSQPWRPWRSYAVMSMWSVPHEKPKKSSPKSEKGKGKAKAPLANAVGETTAEEGTGALPASVTAAAKRAATTAKRANQRKEEATMDLTCTYASPLGDIELASNGEALIGLWFKGQKYDAATLSPTVQEKPDDPVLAQARAWLDAYFEGRDPGEIPSCAPRGSEFRQLVWAKLAEIPYGELVTYGDIAKAIEADTGKKCSARAVGGAVGHNPVSIILPCHRVVGASRSLTGYAGGIERKIALLKLEGVDMSSLTVPTKGTAL
ncbi:methylated-DNA--[protein]-cysteine S-methyltransferase [uncultured Ellagibacter sp.]|uniref:methylated-DNA--[protein]-cysteine S-methyltransferase n=1 Tax=uncultured Ellagibacter sp. TaxID=2137580 RepID=UPI00263925FE|nr:methylated-DNA--[protein]-cysteine S-methyltransferase [uncultured Ellagibacter sp.]